MLTIIYIYISVATTQANATPPSDCSLCNVLNDNFLKFLGKEKTLLPSFKCNSDQKASFKTGTARSFSEHGSESNVPLMGQMYVIFCPFLN